MFQIKPISIERASGFYEALDAVARERIYLAQTEARSLEWAQDFVSANIKCNYALFVALNNGTVIGWCDILGHSLPGFGYSPSEEHSGRSV